MNGYSKSVIRRAEQILGYGITDLAGQRTYPVIDGVVYTDLFSDSDPIVIPGYTGTIQKAFNGRVNGIEYYNQINLDVKHKKLKEVTLDLFWGSECFFKEIDGLLEWLADNTAADNLDDAGVTSKKMEDFSATYRTAAEKQLDLNTILHDGFGYYIRRISILGISKEQKDGFRYF